MQRSIHCYPTWLLIISLLFLMAFLGSCTVEPGSEKAKLLERLESKRMELQAEVDTLMEQAKEAGSEAAQKVIALREKLEFVDNAIDQTKSSMDQLTESVAGKINQWLGREDKEE